MNEKSALMRVLKEPLVQFAALGSLLFFANSFVTGKEPDPRRIRIDGARRAELAAIFEEGQGRQPSPEELQDLIVQWTQNEVLYREARLMGLDQGDSMIRQRLILKIRNVLFNNIVTETPSVEALKRYFDAHRSKYDRPEAFDIEQFRMREGTNATDASELAAELGSGAAPEEYEHDVRRYEARPRSNLDHLFGAARARELLSREDGQWIVVETDNGRHLARISRRYPAVSADFTNVRSRVFLDWKEASKKADLSGALKEIVDQYDIEVVGGEPRKPAVALNNRPAPEKLR